MEYKVDLDGTEYTGNELPDGISEVTLELNRDPIFHGLLFYCTSNLIFTDAAYQQLKDGWDLSTCDILYCDLYYRKPSETEWTLFFEGNILVNDVEFNLSNCTATASLTDDSFEAKIYNNRDIKVHIGSDRSKNDETITESPTETVSYFSPSTGNYDSTGNGWRVDDAFRTLIQFMSDGEILYFSTLFGQAYSNNWYYLFITTGASLVDKNEDSPYVSFEELFTGIDKRIPIAITIEETEFGPRARIESRDYTFDTNLEIGSYRQIGRFNGSGEGLIAQSDEDSFYDRVRVGSETTQKQDGTFEFPDVLFTNWKAEEYHVLGNCNLSNQLDLVDRNFIVDSNVIEDVIETPNDEYDEELFLVECEDNVGSIRAIKYTESALDFYNQELWNQKIIERYSEFIPNSIAQYITLRDNDGTFEASIADNDDNGGSNYTAAPIVLFSPYPFDDEIKDDGGNYDVTTYEFTAPSNGFYEFEASWLINTVDITLVNEDPEFEISAILNHRESDGSTLIESFEDIETRRDLNEGSAYRFTITQGVYMNSGEVMESAFQIQAVRGELEFYINRDSYFKCLFAFNGGGIVASKDVSEYRARVYEFSYPLTIGEWEDLKTNRNGYVNINPGGQTENDILGFIRNISYNFGTQVAEFEIISSE